MNDLLIPRFQVIADYPNSSCKVGDILIKHKASNLLYSENDKTFQSAYTIEMLDRYPHIFRKLEWWENRAEEEMPEYLKVNSDGSFAKIKRWDMSRMWGIENSSSWCDLGLWKHSPEQYQPATEQEYNDYINSL